MYGEATMLYVVDSAHGQYMPQILVERYRGMITVASDEDMDIVAQGPEASEYWEAWEQIVQDALIKDKNGKYWTIYEDVDLWLIREDHVWEDDN